MNNMHVMTAQLLRLQNFVLNPPPLLWDRGGLGFYFQVTRFTVVIHSLCHTDHTLIK